MNALTDKRVIFFDYESDSKPKLNFGLHLKIDEKQITSQAKILGIFSSLFDALIRIGKVEENPILPGRKSFQLKIMLKPLIEEITVDSDILLSACSSKIASITLKELH
jgi:hypothetical protein